MASIIVQGYRVKVSGWDAFIAFWLPLWNEFGDVRKMPRNLNSIIWSFGMAFGYSLMGVIVFAVSWYLSQWPFIWPEAIGGMVCVLCIIVGYEPYRDVTRAFIGLGVGLYLLHKHVTFYVTIFGYHIEKYLYYTIIAAAIVTIWRYLLNQLCWSQIDRMCKKYGFPEYDQEVLEARYTGIPIREEQLVHETFSDAVASHKQLEGV